MLNQAPATPNYGKPSPALVTPETSIGMLAYRSRAVRPPGPGELEALVRQAQARNRIEGLTGLLIYDQGCFFQWLEGPTTGLARVWDSISRDPRHYECQILREQFMPRRFFGAWDMRLTTRTRGSTDLSLSSPELVQMPQLWNTRPARLSAEIWDEIFADMVLPKLFARHRPMLPAAASAAIAWHARGETPAELAGLLLALDAGATADYVDALVAQGADLDTLYREVFEPAARVLGGLWQSDHTREIDLTLGLGRLQLEVHRVGAILPHPWQAARPGHAILVAPQPGEPHGLNAAMSTELFTRDGWDVSCEFPSSDRGLGQLLHDRWFDVLDLSSSAALRRGRELRSMQMTIRAALAASRNPALAVIVDGRLFFERPDAYFDVGADAGCVSVVESVAAAQRLLDDLATQHRIEHSMIERRHDAWVGTAGGAVAGAAAAASLRLFEKRFKSTVF